MLWETKFYPLFDNLMNNQSWLSLVQEELTWSEEFWKKSIEKMPVPKEIIVIDSNNKEEADEKRETIVINNSSEDNDWTILVLLSKITMDTTIEPHQWLWFLVALICLFSYNPPTHTYIHSKFIYCRIIRSWNLGRGWVFPCF